LAVSGLLALLLVGLGVGTLYNVRLSESNARLEGALSDLRESREQTEAALTKAEMYQYFNRVSLAGRVWRAGDAARAGRLLEDCPARQRGWEWYCLKRLLRAPPRKFPVKGSAFAFSRDGRRLVSGGPFELEPAADQPGPDGRPRFSEGSKRVRVWNAKTGEEVAVLRGHAKWAAAVAYSPNGRHVASAGSDGIRVWDPGSEQEVRFIPDGPEESGGAGLAYTPDGRRLAAVCRDRAVAVWDVETGRELFRVRPRFSEVVGLSFSPDGRRLVTASLGASEAEMREAREGNIFEGEVAFWDANSGAKLFSLSCPDLRSVAQPGRGPTPDRAGGPGLGVSVAGSRGDPGRGDREGAGRGSRS
jgi:DNA-binding beta-propeller fold protein YncE